MPRRWWRHERPKAQVSISIKRIFMTTIFTVWRINSGDKPDKLKALTGVGLGVSLKLIGIDHFVFIASATAKTIAEKAAKFSRLSLQRFRQSFHGPAIPPRSHTKTVVCNEKHSNWHDQLNKWCFQWNQLKTIYFLCKTEWTINNWLQVKSIRIVVFHFCFCRWRKTEWNV